MSKPPDHGHLTQPGQRPTEYGLVHRQDSCLKKEHYEETSASNL